MDELKSESIGYPENIDYQCNNDPAITQKRPDKLTVLELIKKDSQTTITYNDNNENLLVRLIVD